MHYYDANSNATNFTKTKIIPHKVCNSIREPYRKGLRIGAVLNISESVSIPGARVVSNVR